MRNGVPRLAWLLALLVLGHGASVQASGLDANRGASGWAAPAHTQARWWHSGYLVDYGLIAAGGLVYLIGHDLGPADNALIGPVYDPADPAALLDPKYRDRLGRAFVLQGVGETVSATAVVVMLGAGGLALALQEGLHWASGGRGDARWFHDTMVGYLETISLTAGSTEIAKALVGRLRPDYQNRVRRLHCASLAVDPTLCPDGQMEALGPTAADIEDVMVDGRRSFWSGHAAHSFNLATYLSLAIGGRYVWGEHASAGSAAFGILGQTALLGTATFIAASRVEDGRHHPSDVFTGALVGLGLAQLSYWRRFAANGKPRPRREAGATSVELEAGPGVAGLAVTLRYR